MQHIDKKVEKLTQTHRKQNRLCIKYVIEKSKQKT